MRSISTMHWTGIGSAALLAALLGNVAVAKAAPDRRLQTGDSARYLCSDARAIEVLYGGGIAVVTIGDKALQMQRAPRTDGERYFGGGWQWLSTGKRTGTLIHLDAAQESDKQGIACHAP